MQGAIRLNPWNINFPNDTTISLEKFDENNHKILGFLNKKISNNHNSENIIVNRAVDVNIDDVSIKTYSFSYTVDINSYIERRVIDMNYEIELEMHKIIKRYNIVHLTLLILCVILTIVSWGTNILPTDIVIVAKPMSIAFSLMIFLNYIIRRPK